MSTPSTTAAKVQKTDRRALKYRRKLLPAVISDGQFKDDDYSFQHPADEDGTYHMRMDGTWELVGASPDLEGPVDGNGIVSLVAAVRRVTQKRAERIVSKALRRVRAAAGTASAADDGGGAKHDPDAPEVEPPDKYYLLGVEMRWLWRLSGLKQSARRVGLHLLWRMSMAKYGAVDVAHSELAKWGMTASSVHRGITALVQSGLIERPKVGTGRDKSRYRGVFSPTWTESCNARRRKAAKNEAEKEKKHKVMTEAKG